MTDAKKLARDVRRDIKHAQDVAGSTKKIVISDKAVGAVLEVLDENAAAMDFLAKT